MEDIMKLCDVVRETGFAIHRYHKHGHLEKVHENALAHRLRKLGLDVKQQYPLKVSGKAACQSKALGWTAGSLMKLLPSRMIWSRLINCLPRAAVLSQRLSWQIWTWISLPA
jgi:hypothetical protein